MDGMFFSRILSMSLTGSYLILFACAARLVLKLFGRKYSYYLWMAVFLSLWIPVLPSASFSLIPQRVLDFSQESTELEKAENVKIPEDDAAGQKNMVIYSGESALFHREELEKFFGEQEKLTVSAEEEQALSVSKEKLFLMAQWIWLGGIVLFSGYSLWSAFRLNRSIREKKITVPFLWGIFRPVIYLPDDLDLEEREYILAHEQCHRRRKDHLIKLWIYLTAVLHWFNPLVWTAYALCIRDMEISCDEEVIARFGEQIKKAYAGSLLKYAARQNGFLMMTLTFGEPSLKSRIGNVLKFRKKGAALSLAAFALTLVIALGLLCQPKKQAVEPGVQSAFSEPEVLNNGGIVIAAADSICYNLGEPLFSDGESLYATRGGETIYRYKMDRDGYEQVRDGVLAGADDRGNFYYTTKEADGLYLNLWNPKENSVRFDLLGQPLPTEEIRSLYADGKHLIFAAKTYEEGAGRERMGVYSYSREKGTLTKKYLTDSEKIFVLGDRIYYGKGNSLQRVCCSVNRNLEDERKISEELEIVQTDEKRNVLLAESDGRLYALSPDGKERQLLFDLSAAGWTWTDQQKCTFTEVSVIGEDLYLKAEKSGFPTKYGKGSDPVEEYFRVACDGSSYERWDPLRAMLGFEEEDIFYLEDPQPGKPVEDPAENGWDISNVADVSESFQKLPLNPDEEQIKNTYLIGESENYRLYGKGDYESMLLKTGELYCEIAYPYLSNYGFVPEIWEYDADGDGKAEAAIRLHLQYGTGISIESFLLADDAENGKLYVYQLLPGEAVSRLISHLSWEITEEGCQPYVNGVKAGAFVRNQDGLEPFEQAAIGDQIHYYFSEGRAEVSAPIGFLSADVPYAVCHSDHDVTASVSFENGRFILSDFCSKKRNR